MRGRAEAVQPAQFRLGWRCAQLRILHTTARRADEVVMVAGAAANVGMHAPGEYRPDGASPPQELDRAIRRREPEPRVERSCARMELGHGKASLPRLDEPKDRASLRGRTDAVRQGQRRHARKSI